MYLLTPQHPCCLTLDQGLGPLIHDAASAHRGSPLCSISAPRNPHRDTGEAVTPLHGHRPRRTSPPAFAPPCPEPCPLSPAEPGAVGVHPAWGAADRLPPTLPLPQPTSTPPPPPRQQHFSLRPAGARAPLQPLTAGLRAPTDDRTHESHTAQPRAGSRPTEGAGGGAPGGWGSVSSFSSSPGPGAARAHPAPPATRRDGFPGTHCPPQASAFPHSSPLPPGPSKRELDLVSSLSSPCHRCTH